jgi:soluble lytic murein transglycosylase
MRSAFLERNWKAMELLYAGASSVSDDAAPLSLRDRSLYLNALWIQGRYAEGVGIIESMMKDEDARGGFPDTIEPYVRMLLILGEERTGKKEVAYENGRELWETAPSSLKYYLSYALGRLSRDLSKYDESIAWFRRMLNLSADKKRRRQALIQMVDLPGINAEEAAALLIDSPSNAKALALCRALPKAVAAPPVEYALGYNDYINKRYDSAMNRFELASADAVCGEAARYYLAYSAYRVNKNAAAFSLWSGIALTGRDYPQRSVQRLVNLAKRGMAPAVLSTLRKVYETRDDYPDLACDAMAAVIQIGGADAAQVAQKLLYSKYPASNHAAALRWESGWRAWKKQDYRTAYEQWSSGYSPEIKNSELAARLLYWQAKALYKLKSPVAAGRVRERLATSHPAEYYTFLADPRGGITSADVPVSGDKTNILEEWGFVTYARLESENSISEEPGKPDIPALYRSARLAAWEGDFSSAMRSLGILRKLITPGEYSSSSLLRLFFPRAFESMVSAASRQTSIDTAVIWGVMRQESLYEPDVTSSAGAYGLMQLMPATAREEAKKMKMDPDAYKQPSGNILLGANHLVGLLARFKDMPRSLAAYNAGGSPVARWSRDPITDMDEWVEDIGYAETRGYVKAVIRNINVYKALYRENSK